jgi:hypothetical protein
MEITRKWMLKSIWAKNLKTGMVKDQKDLKDENLNKNMIWWPIVVTVKNY